MAAKRKSVKKPAAKKGPAKAKPRANERKRPAAEDRELHYSDLRKVMLASVLKRLK